jgi:hypothetical protein
MVRDDRGDRSGTAGLRALEYSTAAIGRMDVVGVIYLRNALCVRDASVSISWAFNITKMETVKISFAND